MTYNDTIYKPAVYCLPGSYTKAHIGRRPTDIRSSLHATLLSTVAHIDVGMYVYQSASQSVCLSVCLYK